jgi:general secretion pathway protein A
MKLMYTKHFGLKALPFENSPDPTFFFDQGQYNQILATTYDSVTAGRGLMVVSGPIGAGKTTLNHKLISDLPKDTKIIWLVAPTSTVDEMVMFIAEEIGIPYEARSRVFMIRDIRNKLLEMKDARRLCLMVIDESHMINDNVLEGIRILTNLEQGATKLLQIILLGQEELVAKLERPELESFKQRIATQKVLGKMDFERVKEYVLHRLKVAGGENGLFSDNALEMVAHATNGIPRIINSLCHTAMRIACEQHKHAVEPKDVHNAAEELGYGRETFHYLIKFKTQPDASISKKLEQTPNHGLSRRMASSPEQLSFLQDRPQKEMSWFWPLALLFLSFVSLAASLLYYALRFNLLF